MTTLPPKIKKQVLLENMNINGGINRCVNYNIEAIRPNKHERGITATANEIHMDHIISQNKGEKGTITNAQIICRTCNLNKSYNK